MAAQDKAAKVMRPEKLQFMGMRNAFKVTSELVDPLLAWKDQMHEIAEESGLIASYLMREMLTQLGIIDSVFDAPSPDEDDESESEPEEEEEMEGPVDE